MGSIAGSDAYLLFASQSAILTVVMLGILWSARSTAVYLYLLSSLVGAGYFLIFALAAPAGAMTASMTFLALSITAIGSAWLKNIALGLLDSPKFPLSGYLRGSVIILIGMLSIPFLFPDPDSFSVILTL